VIPLTLFAARRIMVTMWEVTSSCNLNPSLQRNNSWLEAINNPGYSLSFIQKHLSCGILMLYEEDCFSIA